MAIGRTTYYSGNTIVKAGILAYLDEYIGGLNKVRVLKIFQDHGPHQSLFAPSVLATYAQVVRIRTTIMGEAGMVFTIRADDVIPCGCVRVKDGSYRLRAASSVVLG